VEFLEAMAERVALGLELLSVLVIAVGGVEAAVRSLGPWLTRRSTHGNRREAWLGFARWLLIGLEFMLAADIVRTAIAPTFEQIGQLAAIAVIRTFLNYFLERDLEKAAEMPEPPAAAARSTAD
jgi:uncharacterized membrane protein